MASAFYGSGRTGRNLVKRHLNQNRRRGCRSRPRNPRTGYNGLVRGVDDNKPERLERPTKYDFFEHAERNAIYNACLTGTSLKGCVKYATHAPCTDCARAIIQAGIAMVVTHKVEIDESTPQNTWRDKLGYSREMFDEAGVEYLELPLK